jgi:hypothetical protein
MLPMISFGFSVRLTILIQQHLGVSKQDKGSFSYPNALQKTRCQQWKQQLYQQRPKSLGEKYAETKNRDEFDDEVDDEIHPNY